MKGNYQMTTCKKCNNCAWYCHSDGRCYGQMATICGYPVGIGDGMRNRWACSNWSFDGLGDQEREDLDTLVTMEKTTA